MGKLKQLVKMTGNHRHYANYCSQKANNLTQTDHQNKAETNKLLKQAEKHAKISGTIYGQRNYYEAAGFIRLAEGNYDEAYTTLSHAEKIEEQYIPAKLFRKSTFCKLFIEARDDYAASAAKLSALNKAVDPAVAPSFKKYIIGATKYIYGPDSVTRNEGIIALKDINANAAFSSHRHAAEMTLNNKILSVV